MHESPMMLRFALVFVSSGLTYACLLGSAVRMSRTWALVPCPDRDKQFSWRKLRMESDGLLCCAQRGRKWCSISDYRNKINKLLCRFFLQQAFSFTDHHSDWPSSCHINLRFANRTNYCPLGPVRENLFNTRKSCEKVLQKRRPVKNTGLSPAVMWQLSPQLHCQRAVHEILVGNCAEIFAVCIIHRKA